MSNFANLIKVWELNRASPLTTEFLDSIVRSGYGKRENNYYIFRVDIPDVYDNTNQSQAFNLCKRALNNESKYKRHANEKYLAMMFTL